MSTERENPSGQKPEKPLTLREYLGAFLPPREQESYEETPESKMPSLRDLANLTARGFERILTSISRRGK